MMKWRKEEGGSDEEDRRGDGVMKRIEGERV